MGCRAFAVPAAREEEFCRDWTVAKLSTPALEAKYDVSRASVYATVRRLGLTPRQPHYTRRLFRCEPVKPALRPKPNLWRCLCGNLSTSGPACGRCQAVA